MQLPRQYPRRLAVNLIQKYAAVQYFGSNLRIAAFASSLSSKPQPYFAASSAQRRSKLNAEQQLLASKSLNIMIKSFAASGSGLADILRLRQQTLDYEYRHMEALADSNISIAWLKRLAAFTE